MDSNIPTPIPPSTARPGPKVAFAMATLLTVIVLGLTLFNRRPAQASPAEAKAESAKEERAAAGRLIPPPVPDDQNFAATPYFASLFAGSKLEKTPWPEDFSRADQFPRRFPVMAESPAGQSTGRLVTDLVAWRKAFEETQRSTPSEEININVSETPEPAANAEAAKTVLTYLKPYESVLKELHEADKRPFARFNVNYALENPWSILLPHLAVVKRTSQLLRLKTSCEVAAGQGDKALEDALLMLRLADAPKDEAMLISHLVRVACLQITMQPIWEGLAGRCWSEPQLAELQSRLQQFDFISDLKRALDSERLWANVTIGLVRDKRTPNLFLSMVTTDGKAEPWQKEAERAFLKCPRDWFDQEQTNYNRLFAERLMSGIDFKARRVNPGLTEDNSRQLGQDFGRSRNLLQDHLIFAKVLMPALGNVSPKMTYAQATVDLATIACALERHRLAKGSYPESLAALAPAFLSEIPKDLIDGQPARYRRNGDGTFTLYFVGWNETDDNGEPAFLASGRGTELKHGDWVWRYAAR